MNEDYKSIIQDYLNKNKDLYSANNFDYNDYVQYGDYIQCINPYKYIPDEIEKPEKTKPKNLVISNETKEWIVKILITSFLEKEGMDPDKDFEEYLKLKEVIINYGINNTGWDKISERYEIPKKTELNRYNIDTDYLKLI